MRQLRATEVAASVFAIDYASLRRRGKNALLFDLDNTLHVRGATSVDPQVCELFGRLEEQGFRIGILTNRRRGREDPVIQQLARRVPLIHLAHKPSRGGFLELLRLLDASPAEAVMIGDRRWTDVFGANRCGIFSIRVRGVRP
jgi:HAD superfamily phosphatase (TIGR01668 family)